MSFDGKVVLITGAGTGIGADTAARFVAEGARVVLNGRREEMLRQTADRIDPDGTKTAIVAGDVSKPITGRRMVQAATERFGGVDILISNAGIFKPTRFLEHTEEDVANYIGIILSGSFFMAQAAIPAMQARGKGAIVHVGSLWASQAIGATPSSAYSAAKAGVHALTRNLAIEFAASNIRVNAVAPAVVETPVYNTFLTDEQVASVLPTFNAFHPLGRNGQAGDVAKAILFLASDDADWITGAILPVDGGVMAGQHAK